MSPFGPARRPAGLLVALELVERGEQGERFAVADPQVAEGVSSTGTRHYYTDSNLSTIKGTDENRPAKADDPSI